MSSVIKKLELMIYSQERQVSRVKLALRMADMMLYTAHSEWFNLGVWK